MLIQLFKRPQCHGVLVFDKHTVAGNYGIGIAAAIGHFVSGKPFESLCRVRRQRVLRLASTRTKRNRRQQPNRNRLDLPYGGPPLGWWSVV